MLCRLANAVGPNDFSMPYRLAGSDTYPRHTGRPMQLAQIVSPCHTGWPYPIPIRAIPVGQCSLPKSFVRAIQVGRIQYLSMPYRLANAVGPNRFSVPYRLAGSDTYPCHTGRPMQLAQIISPCHTGRPMQSTQIICPCHTGWLDSIPIRAIPVSQCSWRKSVLHAIQVGRI